MTVIAIMITVFYVRYIIFQEAYSALHDGALLRLLNVCHFSLPKMTAVATHSNAIMCRYMYW